MHNKNSELRAVYFFTIEDYIKVYELAEKHGKKPGDSMQEEFEQVKKENPKKFHYLGATDKDKDILLGDLREEATRFGIRIGTNLNNILT